MIFKSCYQIHEWESSVDQKLTRIPEIWENGQKTIGTSHHLRTQVGELCCRSQKLHLECFRYYNRTSQVTGCQRICYQAWQQESQWCLIPDKNNKNRSSLTEGFNTWEERGEIQSQRPSSTKINTRSRKSQSFLILLKSVQTGAGPEAYKENEKK